MKVNVTNDTQTNLTLTEAVVQAINELKGNKSFSAHDVTNTIRESVNSGEYALPGFETAGAAGGPIRYWVDHEAVKTVIDNLLNSGELANLGLVKVENPTGARPYRLFNFGTTAAAPAPVTPTANATPADDTDTQGPVAQRIKAYLANAGTATLKQIQSALKVNGVTCEDFYNLVTALGFDVQPGTAGKFSTYTVSGN